MVDMLQEDEMHTMRSSEIHEIDEHNLQRLYAWVDEIPLSRPKKNMARDFSDGVLVAEVIKYFAPKIIELHNYVDAHAVNKKVTNWQLLNRKVLTRHFRLDLSTDVVRAITQCKSWAAECFLVLLRDRIDYYLATRRGRRHDVQAAQSEPNLSDWAGVPSTGYYSEQTEADQHSYRGGSVAVEDFYPSGVIHVPKGTDSKKLREINQQSQKFTPRRAVPQKKVEMVPRTLLAEKEKECEDRQQTIEILQAKVQRLEHLLHLKDIRIEDLSSRVDALDNPAPTKYGGSKKGELSPRRVPPRAVGKTTYAR